MESLLCTEKKRLKNPVVGWCPIVMRSHLISSCGCIMKVIPLFYDFFILLSFSVGKGVTFFFNIDFTKVVATQRFFTFAPSWGIFSNLTNIFQTGWFNHQLVGWLQNWLAHESILEFGLWKWSSSSSIDIVYPHLTNKTGAPFTLVFRSISSIHSDKLT